MPSLRVAIESQGAKTGSDKYNKSVRSMQVSSAATAKSIAMTDKSIKKMGTTAGTVAKSIVALATGFAALRTVTSAIRTFVSFEDTMNTVKAVSGATTKQFEELEKTARRMGATTRFSATEAGEGLLFLSRAGFSTSQSIAALPSTLDLASAGAIGLGQAADFASNILTAFNLNAEEMVRVSDALVNTANSSNTSVLQMAEGMKFAAPVAAALGQTLEMTAAAIGTLGNAGIQASLAGTGLRMAMVRLLDPVKKARDAIADMGLTVQELNPDSNTLVEIFGRLADANLTAAQAAEIFGARTIGVALRLTENVDIMRDLNAATLANAGVSKRTAKIMEDDLEGAAKALKSALQELSIAMVDEVEPALRSMIDFSTDVVRSLAGMDEQFIRSGREAQAWAENIKILGVFLATATTMVIGLTVATKALTIAMITNPVALLAISVSAAAAGVFSLRNELVLLGDESVTVGSTIKNTWKSNIDLFKDWKQTIGEAFDDLAKFGVKAVASGGFLPTPVKPFSLADDSIVFDFQKGQTRKRGGPDNRGSLELRAAADRINANTLRLELEANSAREQALTLLQAMEDARKRARKLLEDEVRLERIRAAQALAKLKAIKAENIDRFADNIGEAFSNAFLDIATGAATAQEAIRQLGAEIARLVLQKSVADPIATFISSAISGALAPGGTVESVTSTGGISFTGRRAANPQAFASGGIVTRPTFAMIGESGPEMIIPLRNPMGGNILASGGIFDGFGTSEFQGFGTGGNIREELLGFALNIFKTGKGLASQVGSGTGIAGGAGLLANLGAVFRSLNLEETLPGLGKILTTNPLNSLFSAAIGGAFDFATVLGENLLPQLSIGLIKSNPGLALASGAFGLFQNTLNNPNFGIPDRLASGGIINQAGVFNAGNRTALIGEAGPEAILPLTRTGNGQLGVAAVGASGGTTIVNMTISTPDANSFRRSRRQIIEGMRRLV